MHRCTGALVFFFPLDRLGASGFLLFSPSVNIIAHVFFPPALSRHGRRERPHLRTSSSANGGAKRSLRAPAPARGTPSPSFRVRPVCSPRAAAGGHSSSNGADPNRQIIQKKARDGCFHLSSTSLHRLFDGGLRPQGGCPCSPPLRLHGGWMDWKRVRRSGGPGGPRPQAGPRPFP